MGICVHCGESAGFLRTKHSKCEELNEKGVQMLPRFIKETFEARADANRLGEILVGLKKSAFISEEQLKRGVFTGINACVDSALDDHNLRAHPQSLDS